MKSCISMYLVVAQLIGSELRLLHQRYKFSVAQLFHREVGSSSLPGEAFFVSTWHRRQDFIIAQEPGLGLQLGRHNYMAVKVVIVLMMVEAIPPETLSSRYTYPI
ncbi:hypothetical protein P167DRAFT_547763 [Morchella conica CCBAS932]|uniref:Uncharacterized protein n=1 Tax=Morchella conica CCBAS932 TaxID=1392247 RepID=A0A3N4KKC5_9PEZI|nr:hypothetical protein P167DRAFT_547763 [Morchella conica CCBAS932]